MHPDEERLVPLGLPFGPKARNMRTVKEQLGSPSRIAVSLIRCKLRSTASAVLGSSL